jgi:predicted nuclease with RNAse H fold
MTSRGSSFFVGWDVGAWHCDKGKSQDAVVILDSGLNAVGNPWRGNLREALNNADSSTAWVNALFQKCGVQHPDSIRVTLAIDAPLGFSEGFLALSGSLKGTTAIQEHRTNPYLFRVTERHLFERGCKPLSAVQDMIGSQATKGIHAVARLAPYVESCGVWTDGKSLRVIETYPSPCKRAPIVKRELLQSNRGRQEHEDIEDAHICAVIAYLFANKQSTLLGPPPEASSREGWIWVPKQLKA